MTASSPSSMVTIYKQATDPHFKIPLKLDGERFSFMLDTRAPYLTLSREDAKKAGINLEELKYTLTMNTAFGGDNAARWTFKNVLIGFIHLNDIQTLVGENIQQSVVGISVLKKLHFEMHGNELTFWPKDH